MNLPPFAEFWESIDLEKAEYDMESYSPENMKESYNPFSKEQYMLMVKTNVVLTKALLQQYHQWLREKLES